MLSRKGRLSKKDVILSEAKDLWKDCDAVIWMNNGEKDPSSPSAPQDDREH